MKGKKTALLLVQFALVVAFGVGMYFFTSDTIKPTIAYQYNKNLGINMLVTEQDITPIEVPKAAIQSNFVVNKADIVGKYVSSPVYMSQYVINSNLIEEGALDIFETMDMTKLRKASIPMNYENSFGGDVNKGEFVDLLYIGTETVNEKKFSYSKTILSNIPIYSVTTSDGYEYTSRASERKGETDADGNTTDGGAIGQITLAVTLEQAEEIAARSRTGEIIVVGRFEESVDYTTTGYVHGDFAKVFSGIGVPETNE